MASIKKIKIKRDFRHITVSLSQSIDQSYNIIYHSLIQQYLAVQDLPQSKKTILQVIVDIKHARSKEEILSGTLEP
jgi:hypothetical protein